MFLDGFRIKRWIQNIYFFKYINQNKHIYERISICKSVPNFTSLPCHRISKQQRSYCVRVFNKRYITDSFSIHHPTRWTEEIENRYGTNFPSTLGDSPSSLISRNSLTTACRCHKDRFCASMQSDNRQLISAKEDHDAPAKCTCTSSNL